MNSHTYINKPTLFFAHSAGAQYAPGKGSYDLVRYIRSELSDEFKIVYPVIPKPNTPTYHKYRQMFRDSFANINEPLVLVGHSLGASTLLKFLSEEKPRLKILGLFLVSCPHWKSNMKEFELKKDFVASLSKIPKIFLYHSKTDQDVPIESLQFYQSSIKNALVRLLPGNEYLFSNGLPKLISDIRSI